MTKKICKLFFFFFRKKGLSKEIQLIKKKKNTATNINDFLFLFLHNLINNMNSTIFFYHGPQQLIKKIGGQ